MVIKNFLTHVDFLAVSMNEKLRAYVAIQFTGLSLAVKDHSAILVTGVDRVHVECFPQDLPEKIEQDIVVPLAEEQQKLYSQILRQVRESVT